MLRNIIALITHTTTRRAIDQQIEEYISHKTRTAPTMTQLERPTLQRFARFSEIRDASEIQVRHIREFEKLLKDQLMTNYGEDRALRSLRGFLRYAHKRGHLCPAPEVVSRSSYQQQHMALRGT